MTTENASQVSAPNDDETMRYAKVWQALVSGKVATRRDDLHAWYRAAQHVIGVCLHEAHLEAVLHDNDDHLSTLSPAA